MKPVIFLSLVCSLTGIPVFCADLEPKRAIKVGSSRRPCCWHVGKTVQDTFPKYPTSLKVKPDANNYRTWMLVWIADNWIPLECKSGIQARVAIKRNGKLAEYKITKPCKRNEMNEAAGEAIKAAAFGKFPDDWKEDQRVFLIDFDDVEYFPPSKKRTELDVSVRWVAYLINSSHNLAP